MKIRYDYILEGASAMILAAVVLYLLYKMTGHDLVGFTEGHK